MEKSPPLDIAAMLFLLFLCLIRGGNFIAIKVSLSGLKPLLSSGGRNFIAASVLIFYVWCMRRQFRYPRQQVVILLFMGVVLAANFAIVYSGMQYTTASRSSIILNAQPLFVALLTCPDFPSREKYRVERATRDYARIRVAGNLQMPNNNCYFVPIFGPRTSMCG